MQQENNRTDSTDWDYIIPICLCSEENCQCIKNTSRKLNRNKTEKDLKRGKTEDIRKRPPTYQCVMDSRERTSTVKKQGMSTNPPQTAYTNTHPTNHKPLQEMLTLNKKLNTDVGKSSPVENVSPSCPHSTWRREINGDEISQGTPGGGQEEDTLGSEQMYSVPQHKPVSAAPWKPTPLPRKPKTAVLAQKEKVEEEREEIVNQEVKGMDSKEMTVSLDVNVSESENGKSDVQLARKACASPVHPAKKKPSVSAPEKVANSAPETLPENLNEEDLGWDSCASDVEVSVDKEDEEVEMEVAGKEYQRAVYSNLTHSSPLLSQPEISQPAAMPIAQCSPLPCTQRQDSIKEKEEGELGANEERLVPRQDCVLQEGGMRDLPLPPEEKMNRSILTDGIKPARRTFGKKKAKSFSTADLICSEGLRRNSFRKLLELKLSVRMLPKLVVRGGQSPDCAGDDNEQGVDKDQDECQNLPKQLGSNCKITCPVIGVEQSVDGDDFGTDESPHHYENVRIYEEISDYINVSSTVASSSQPSAWENKMYDDEGIYEEQEPYMYLEKNTGHQQCQTPTDCER